MSPLTCCNANDVHPALPSAAMEHNVIVFYISIDRSIDLWLQVCWTDRWMAAAVWLTCWPFGPGMDRLLSIPSNMKRLTVVLKRVSLRSNSNSNKFQTRVLRAFWEFNWIYLLCDGVVLYRIRYVLLGALCCCCCCCYFFYCCCNFS